MHIKHLLMKQENKKNTGKTRLGRWVMNIRKNWILCSILMMSLLTGCARNSMNYPAECPQFPSPPGKSDAGPRRTSASKEVGDLIEFSNNCAKQADRLTVQLKGLQTWAKEVNQNGN